MNTVTQWGHITLPHPCPLVRRDALRVGDTIMSSHSGARRVARVEQHGTEGQTTYLWLEGIASPEAYPSDSTMPLLHHASQQLYAVVASVERHWEASHSTRGWTGVRQLPTFYLHPSVQGILHADAAHRVAEDMIRSLVGDDAVLHIHVQEVQA